MSTAALVGSTGACFILGPGVERAALAERLERHPEDPAYRPLKIYTIDPSSRRLEGSTTIIHVPYEPLSKGPMGRRFKVESVPDGPFKSYGEVDLEDPRILVRNGRDPAPSDPVFHHQMVYAVCSSVYAAFQRALGREIAWGFDSPVLRVLPHAINKANAEYSRQDGALLFGWFSGAEGRVFTCLSHDIIAHELTHALLDGLRARFEHPVSADVIAFHEAFADLVAIFHRFSYQDVVTNAIRRTAGDISRKNLLHQIAGQFARGRGSDRALRQVDLSENPAAYDPGLKPHQLGSILVSAVFDAFVVVYRRKTARYIRLATGGTGILPQGAELPSDLVEILSRNASRLAKHFLYICIRAIDYCPPVDIDFGEYLRALVTADYNLVPDDPWAYREALIEAFARRQIFPTDVYSLTEDGLLWRPGDLTLRIPRLDFGSLKFSGDPGSPANRAELKRQATLLGGFIIRPEHIKLFGCANAGDPSLDGDDIEPPVIESVRSSRRVGPDGQLVFDLIAEVTQRRILKGGNGYPTFDFYGGATIILGPRGEIRYIIKKKVTNTDQARRQREYFLKSQYAIIFAARRCLLGTVE
jgi:hypothetical protein